MVTIRLSGDLSFSPLARAGDGSTIEPAMTTALTAAARTLASGSPSISERAAITVRVSMGDAALAGAGSTAAVPPGRGTPAAVPELSTGLAAAIDPRVIAATTRTPGCGSLSDSKSAFYCVSDGFTA